MALRDQFIKALGNKPLLEVNIQDYDITAYIGKLSAGERTAILKRAFAKDENGNSSESPFDQMCLMLQLVLRDEGGARAFTDSQEDLEIIRGMDGGVVETLFAQAMEFNGIGEKAIPAAVKN